MSLIALLFASALACAAGPAPKPAPLELPGGGAGIGFDDLTLAPGLGRLLVPGGRTGKLFLVDPATRKVEAVEGFSAQAGFSGGHGEGTTSADAGGGYLFAIDRNTMRVAAIDPAARLIVSSAPLAGSPDYVRWAAGEVWVTEPDSEQIEVFAFSAGKAPALKPSALIPVPGGPESLVIDAARGRAYTHLWDGATWSIDLKTRGVAGRWKNGCKGSRGIALEEKRGLVFAGCAEGKAVVLDAAGGGKILGSVESGDGVDIISYDPLRARLYLPGARSATLAVIAIGDAGRPALLRVVPTVRGAHCAVSDGRGGVWVCDPDHGRLLEIRDPL